MGQTLSIMQKLLTKLLISMVRLKTARSNWSMSTMVHVPPLSLSMISSIVIHARVGFGCGSKSRCEATKCCWLHPQSANLFWSSLIKRKLALLVVMSPFLQVAKYLVSSAICHFSTAVWLINNLWFLVEIIDKRVYFVATHMDIISS